MQLKKCVNSASHVDEKLKTLHVEESINYAKTNFVYFKRENRVIIAFGVNFRFVVYAIKVKESKSESKKT